MDMIVFYFNKLLDLAIVIYDIYICALKIGAAFGVSYIASYIVIGLPCSIIEAVTKKKIPDKLQHKIQLVFTVAMAIYLVYLTFR